MKTKKRTKTKTKKIPKKLKSNIKERKKSKIQKKSFSLSPESKKQILGVVFLLTTLIASLSFFGTAGIGGRILRVGLLLFVGRTMYIVPVIFFLLGVILIKKKEESVIFSAVMGSILTVLGFSGIFESIGINEKGGGLLGYVSVWPISKLFGPLVANIVFGAVLLIGFFFFWQLIKHKFEKKEKEIIKEENEIEKEAKVSVFNKIRKKKIIPEFNIKSLEEESPSFVIDNSSNKKESSENQKETTSKSSQYADFMLPPINLLSGDKGKVTAGDTKINSAIIKKTLESFDIPVEMSAVCIGPTVTQFSLKPAEGVKLSKITTLSNDLALSLAAHPIRIEAPIPGKSLVGIEIPNKSRAMVGLKDLFSDPNFRGHQVPLNLALGKDVAGAVEFANIAKMPHLLVAGSTGSGKTIFLNTLILSLLYQNTPETLKMILVDPKRVEFAVYAGLPHLLAPIVHKAGKAVKCLEWMIEEMEKRFEMMAEKGVRNILSYNKKEKDNKLPYIVFVIDELADLMMARGKELEANIVRVAQMARAVGIHLVLATQRPSVEVITGLIKANIPARISFLVASQIDSRTILDTSGAEKLLGSGDMLFLSADANKPKRIQGAYVAEQEVKDVIDYIKSNTKVDIDTDNELSEELQQRLEQPEGGTIEMASDDDPLFEDAKRTVLSYKKASASMLQRYLRVGYSRAARLIDMLEENGVVGPQEGSKPREVFDISDNKEDEEISPFNEKFEESDSNIERESKTESTVILEPEEE